MKRTLNGIIWGLIAILIVSANAWGFGRKTVVKVGINAPITGDIPKVGEGTKYAAQMWLEDIEKAGGIAVGGKKYPVELVIEDNESKAESAVKANTKMITEDEVLVIVGPQSSKQAVPAGDVANNYETPMITPNFITEEFDFTKAAVLYDVASDYPKGLAEFFKEAWEKIHGPDSVVAFESFTTKDTDFSSQLSKINKSDAQVLFTPQYYNEVALIVQQAHELGWTGPIVGSDSWGSAETVTLCGKDCYGLFFSTHYAAAGAQGATKEFIERYEKKYGYTPDDVAALTWDSLRLVQAAIENSGKLTGKIGSDRKAVRDALAQIKNFNGITGDMTFTEEGDPIKCAVIVRISDKGEYEFYKSVCPN
jgi:branched-chain amino acid transport system substrate-binding protein